MPNTLAHLGFQTICSKVIIPEADFKWIAVGCIVPDLPWIVQRIIPFVRPNVDMLDLRLYCIVQASLCFCLLIAGAVGFMLRGGGRIFFLLGINCLLHLFLDASQIKWANGVHFLVPLSWKIVNFGFYWPESSITFMLIALGVLVLAFYAGKDFHKPVVFLFQRTRVLAGILLVLGYFFLPFLFLQAVQLADNHFVGTLKGVTRAGKWIALDRATFERDQGTVTLFTGEKLKVIGTLPENDSILSLQGRFQTEKIVIVTGYHLHNRFRDISTLVGLCLVALLWLAFLVKKGTTRRISVE